MMKRICVFLLCLCLLLAAGCSKVPAIMDDGAGRFAQGKQEENYGLKNSGALLDDLIDRFSGSYQMPTGTKLDDSYVEMTYEVRLDNKQDLVALMLGIDGVHDATLVACQTEAGA